jgi:hypothetical protein
MEKRGGTQSVFDCSLPESWRKRAGFLREAANANEAATAYEFAAKELDHWLAEQGDTLLTVRQAAERVARDPETIEKAIRDGRLPQAGKKGAPRVRARDLAARYGAVALTGGSPVGTARTNRYDVNADARSLLARRGG